jgi:hypothetical protein
MSRHGMATDIRRAPDMVKGGKEFDSLVSVRRPRYPYSVMCNSEEMFCNLTNRV